MHLYAYLLKIQLLNALAYRFEYLSSIGRNLFFLLGFVFLWRTAYRGIDQVAGVTEAQDGWNESPMEIAFIGDVHGRVCHALSVLLVCQSERRRPFDLVVQVGDLGVLPDRRTGDVPYDRFEAWDPAVYDLARLILLDDAEATLPGRIREHLSRPILVTAGNHDEFAALRSLDEDEPGHPQPIDPHGIFEYVPDGFVHHDRDVLVGFCEAGDPSGLDSRSEDAVDVLVSHEGGFGVDAESDGLAPGPDAMLSFLKKQKPAFHVFGHFHHPVAPRRVYETMCVQVASVVSDARRSTKPVVQEGCVGVLNTDDGAFEFVTGAWLGSYPRESGFHFLAETVEGLDRGSFQRHHS